MIPIDSLDLPPALLTNLKLHYRNVEQLHASNPFSLRLKGFAEEQVEAIAAAMRCIGWDFKSVLDDPVGMEDMPSARISRWIFERLELQTQSERRLRYFLLGALTLDELFDSIALQDRDKVAAFLKILGYEPPI